MAAPIRGLTRAAFLAAAMFKAVASDDGGADNNPWRAERSSLKRWTKMYPWQRYEGEQWQAKRRPSKRPRSFVAAVSPRSLAWNSSMLLARISPGPSARKRDQVEGLSPWAFEPAPM